MTAGARPTPHPTLFPKGRRLVLDDLSTGFLPGTEDMEKDRREEKSGISTMLASPLPCFSVPLCLCVESASCFLCDAGAGNNG
jgi:hypothetical protein